MTVKLTVQPRTKDSSEVSAEKIPAVVYGHKFASTPILVDKKEFDKTFKIAGESTIIELEGLTAPVDVLVKEVVFSPIKGGIIHVDFYVIEKNKEMTANIPLNFIGEAPAAKLGAVINKVLQEVEVVCKPKDLPAHLDVDLSTLVNLEDKIHVSDLVCPKGVKVTNDSQDILAVAEAVKEEVVVEEVVAAADVPVGGKEVAE
jgi:large subunit ribosomal protein L25